MDCLNSFAFPHKTLPYIFWSLMRQGLVVISPAPIPATKMLPPFRAPF